MSTTCCPLRDEPPIGKRWRWLGRIGKTRNWLDFHVLAGILGPCLITKRGKADQLRFYNIAPGSIEESRYYLILFKDLEHGDVSGSSQLLEGVSKLLDAYSRAILNSDC